MSELIDSFIRNTEGIYFVENSLKDILKLFFNYQNNRKQYYYTMYEFFNKKKSVNLKNYYLSLWENGETIMEQEIILNGQKLTESQFNEKKEEIQKQKGIVLVEVSPGVYKTRLHD